MLRIPLLVCALIALAMLLRHGSSGALLSPDPPLRAGANINMVGGPVQIETDANGDLAGLIEGDPFFTKQNELSFAVSSRNPRHLLAGANDYRAVKLPFVETPPAPGAAAAGDVWGGVFISLDQGKHWRSTLLPCYPQDTRPECVASPLSGFEAVADPQVRAGTHGLFYYCGIVFDRGDNADGAVFCSRFVDLNNVEGVDFPLSLPNPPDPEQPFASPIQWVDHNIIQSGTAGQFLDKIAAAVDKVRQGARTETIRVPLNCDPSINDACEAADAADGTVDGFITQTMPCGTVYVAYADFTGSGNNPNSKLLVSRSQNCGRTWTNATVVNQTQSVSQGAALRVAPDGRVSVAWRQFGLDGQLSSIWIAHEDTRNKNNFRFEPAIKIADLEPFQATGPMDLPTRAADLTDSSGATVPDPYHGFRVNTYPTLAIDGQGRYYVAWAQRGWGADVDDDGAVNDGARIVLSTSAKGQIWSAPVAVDPQVPPIGNPTGPPVDPTLTAPQGHQIMPHLSVFEGRLAMVFYDFRDDVFPGILRQLRSEQCDDDATEDRNGDGVANFVDCCLSEVGDGSGAGGGITAADCERLADPEFLESLIPADPANFSPLPVRHTVDTFVAEAVPGAGPVFTVTKASQYTKVLVPRLDGAGNPVPDEFEVVQLRHHSANYPLYGGDKAFMGDYIEINGADLVSTAGGGWEQNRVLPACKSGIDCRPSPVAHVAFSDTRDVVPPEPTIETDSTGRQVLRQDWLSDYVGIPGRERMLDQNAYTARLTGGVALGSSGNFKPLFADSLRSRAYALILENTLNEGLLTASGWIRTPRFYRLSAEAPNGVEVAFTPDFTTPTLDVEVQSLTAIGATLFARKTGGNDFRPRITVYANEIEAIGAAGFKAGGLQAFTVINPDPSNPLPVNVDLVDGFSDILTTETHTPEFVPFDCQELLDVTGPGGVPDGQVDSPALLLIFPECAPSFDGGGNPIWPQVVALRTYWPFLADPTQPQALNASLFNASLFNASLFNPAIYSASLFNPALLDQSVYNWANASLFNASLFNASLFNASLFNASLFNASLFNPAIADSIRNASLFNASLFNASLFNASLFNASLFNASLFNASLFNASLFNASLLNASLFNASLFNASLFNSPVNSPVDGAADSSGPGGVFPAEQVYNSAIFSSPLRNGTRIVDVTFQIDTLANTPSGYFFWPLFQNLPDNAQLIIRRVSESQTLARDPDCLATSADPASCPLKVFPIFDQEVLANILDLPDFRNLGDPSVLSNLLAQATFVAPPGGRIFATLRGTCRPETDNPLVCEGGFDPFAVDGVVVPQADEDGLSGTWTVLESDPSVSTLFNEPITVTAKVGSYNGTLPTGSVTLFVDGTAVGTEALFDVGGQAKASITFTPADFGLNASGSPYTMRARYIEGPGFQCGLGASGADSGCFSQPVQLLVTPVEVGLDDVELGVLVDVETCDTGAFAGGQLTATFDGAPIEVCVQSAKDENGDEVLPPSVSFTVAYEDAGGNALPGPPTNAGTYAVIVTVNDTGGNFSGEFEITLVIEKAAQTIAFDPVGPKTFGDAPFSVTATATSGLAVTLAIAGPATLDGTTVTITGAGTVTVTGSQAGNANFLPAPDKDLVIGVAKAAQTIDFAPLPDRLNNDPPFALVATASSGLAVSFSLTGPAALSGDVVTLTGGVGTVTVTASQGGDANYAPADPVVRSFQVNPWITFVGFGSPVGPAGDPADPGSVPFAGNYGTNKTLTLKWELFQQGTPVTSLDFVHSIRISAVSQPSGDSCSFDPVPLTDLYPTCANTMVCAGGTELRSSGQYVFNWKLTSVPTGCYTVFLNLGSAANNQIFTVKAVRIRVR